MAKEQREQQRERQNATRQGSGDSEQGHGVFLVPFLSESAAPGDAGRDVAAHAFVKPLPSNLAAAHRRSGSGSVFSWPAVIKALRQLSGLVPILRRAKRTCTGSRRPGVKRGGQNVSYATSLEERRLAWLSLEKWNIKGCVRLRMAHHQGKHLSRSLCHWTMKPFNDNVAGSAGMEEEPPGPVILRKESKTPKHFTRAFFGTYRSPRIPRQGEKRAGRCQLLRLEET